MHGIRDTFTAIANINGPDRTRHGIDIFFAVLIPYAHAFAFDDDAWAAGFKWFVLNKMMPNVGLVGFDDAREIIIVKVSVHSNT